MVLNLKRVLQLSAKRVNTSINCERRKIIEHRFADWLSGDLALIILLLVPRVFLLEEDEKKKHEKSRHERKETTPHVSSNVHFHFSSL